MRDSATRLALLFACLLPLAAYGDPPGEPPKERRAEMMERMRTMRAVALANRLDLDEATALRLNGIMKRYDEAREALHRRIRAQMKILREASKSPNPDEKTVDAAIEAVLGAMKELDALRLAEARELVAGLDPARRARLLLFLHEFPKEVRRQMRRHRRQHGTRPGSGRSPARE